MNYYQSMLIEIRILPLAEKALKSAPPQVQVKFARWLRDVETLGLEAVRQTPGYHDEPLKGTRQGQRAIRLNRQWRALYQEQADGSLHLITIMEVTAHDYRTR